MKSPFIPHLNLKASRNCNTIAKQLRFVKWYHDVLLGRQLLSLEETRFGAD
jgi:hypothetical protein